MTIAIGLAFCSILFVCVIGLGNALTLLEFTLIRLARKVGGFGRSYARTQERWGATIKERHFREVEAAGEYGDA